MWFSHDSTHLGSFGKPGMYNADHLYHTILSVTNKDYKMIKYFQFCYREKVIILISLLMTGTGLLQMIRAKENSVKTTKRLHIFKIIFMALKVATASANMTKRK